MKKLLLGVATVTFLAACGGGQSDKKVLLDSCVADGEMDKEQCSCVVDALDENLEKDQMKTLVAAVKKGGDDADMDAVMEDVMGEMSEADQMAIGMSVMPCIMGDLEKLMSE